MIPLLKGLRILDLTSVILGPYATQILGDLGRVIKVEPPEGEQHAPRLAGAAPGLSAIFANFNRHKRSFALDLKREAGKAALRKLVPTPTCSCTTAPGGDGQARLHLQGRAGTQSQYHLRRCDRLRRHGRYSGKPL